MKRYWKSTRKTKCQGAQGAQCLVRRLISLELVASSRARRRPLALARLSATWSRGLCQEGRSRRAQDKAASKRHRSAKRPKPLAAHLMLKLYTLYTSLHFSAYLQVLAGLYSVDWTWWCDDVWCFICKFTAIAVNSCASACIAIMAMLEESTS